jgi:hypothetical protein
MVTTMAARSNAQSGSTSTPMRTAGGLPVHYTRQVLHAGNDARARAVQHRLRTSVRQRSLDSHIGAIDHRPDNTVPPEEATLEQSGRHTTNGRGIVPRNVEAQQRSSARTFVHGRVRDRKAKTIDWAPPKTSTMDD